MRELTRKERTHRPATQRQLHSRTRKRGGAGPCWGWYRSQRAMGSTWAREAHPVARHRSRAVLLPRAAAVAASSISSSAASSAVSPVAAAPAAVAAAACTLRSSSKPPRAERGRRACAAVAEGGVCRLPRRPLLAPPPFAQSTSVACDQSRALSQRPAPRSQCCPAAHCGARRKSQALAQPQPYNPHTLIDCALSACPNTYNSSQCVRVRPMTGTCAETCCYIGT